MRVLLVGADPLARAGLAALLAGEPGLALAGQAAPGEEAVEAAGRLAPDAVAWDLGPGAAPEFDSLAAVAEAGPPVLALLAGEESATEALAAGARGALYRDAAPDRLAAALRATALGLAVLDGALAAALLRPRAADPGPLLDPLTPRELEVLQLLAEGLSNKEIGSRLGISEHTAKFHVAAILGKLGVQGRTEAVTHAARLGLILL